MKDGRPSAVIIDIKDYQKLLDRIEDKEDLADSRHLYFPRSLQRSKNWLPTFIHTAAEK